ncbi:MAG: DUF1559 domain-containing protein, partial [Deltaproteobacteria bacterium]
DTGVSQSSSNVGSIGFNNYRFCVGTTIANNDWAWSGPQNGIFAGYPQQYGIRDVIDGTSNTIAMAERCAGNANNQFDVYGNVAYGFSFSNPDVYPLTNNPGITACAASSQGQYYLPTTQIWGSGYYPGLRWPDGRPYYSVFNTILPPNGPSCEPGQGDWTWAMMAPTSRHTGIVQVLMADGTVRAISQNISLLTWQGLGTRSNGEILGQF